MLASVHNFYGRHRRKIWIYGVVAGGAYAAGKYVSYKIEEWQQAKVEEAQSAARKQYHYESQQKTCTETYLSFLPNIRNVIMEKLNTEQLLEILKMKPENKLEIWDRLKVFAVTRLLCSVISNVILVVMLKVKMNVIGAYSFATMTSENIDIKLDNSDTSTSVLNTSSDNSVLIPNTSNKELNELQLRYLNNIRFFIEEKLPFLIEDCLDIVEQSLSKISLKEKLSHEKLKEICKDAMTKLKAKHASLKNDKHEFCAYMINPVWTESEDSNDIYSRIISETVCILEGIDCSLVIDTCLTLGLDEALDSFRDQFFSYEAKKPDISLEECLKEDFRSNVLPVPKIIPILNSQIHEIFKAGPNKFLDVLFSQDLIRQLARNVYELTCKEYS